ncbi:hypothetical protein [Bosea vestrisii]|uniref:Secreted protein with PEP-CTERM sorting signal n=1 Tax=Bosea vestrisii TaxID=151416 RepID=A0ABW0H738_9HYPH
MSFVKAACAGTAMFFPLAAGLLLPFCRTSEIQLVVLSLGVGLGMFGLLGFAEIEKRER